MCLKRTHRVAALTVWVAVAPMDPLPLIGGAVLAYATGGGMFSPDVDMYLSIPHRGLTHYVEWPVLGGALSALLYLEGIAWWWVLASVALAWGSHLMLDVFSGKRGVPSRLLGTRLTVTAWLWIHTGGWFEKKIVYPGFGIILSGITLFRVFIMVSR
jgi:membrane-bound metal-dependent hydrolase YbcI (DUF457 family)